MTDHNETLKVLCLESDRFDSKNMERLEEELEHISTQELAPYYLALKDKKETVGTNKHYVAYLIGLCDSWSGEVPPLMGDMPDIDVDFSEREPVVNYLKDKYGEYHVAYINNYTHLSGKSAIIDVCRVTEKSVPKNIKDRVEELKSVKLFLKTNPKGISDDVMEVLEAAAALEGNVRQMGKTAAGVIVSRDPITDYAALWKTKEDIASVYDKDDCEDIGFTKMDVLVTTNIAAMEKTMQLVEERGGILPDNIWDLPMDDKAMISEFAKGRTDLVFQYGGYALKRVTVDLKPNSVEDLVAANSLVRPGADHFEYIKRKNGQVSISYSHPGLKDILEETYGLPIYQEQVMAICRQLAGMSWRDVNRVRKMMGKKTYKDEPELKSLFLMGCDKNRVDRSVSESLWTEIKKHGGYSFNKAHCVAYFMQAWANMYFQVHHPFEWFLANLMLENDDKKIATIISYAQDAGVKIGNVDVNKSKAGWSYDGDMLIPGLASIKGLGYKTGEKIAREAERSPFVGWNTVVTNKKQDIRMYYLVQEDAEDKDAKDLYKVAPRGWVMIPKNSFDALSTAGAIPGINGNSVQTNIASGKAVDVTEGKKLHRFWNAVPLSKIADGPCVVHGYLKNCQKRGGSYELNIQGDVPGSLWYHEKLEEGPYLFVTDGKWQRVYLAVKEDKFDQHPMMGLQKKALMATKGPGVAFVPQITKTPTNKFVGIVLAPQPRVIWFENKLEKGWYLMQYSRDSRKWITKPYKVKK